MMLEFIRRGLESYRTDPADSDHQRGFLSCLLQAAAEFPEGTFGDLDELKAQLQAPEDPATTAMRNARDFILSFKQDGVELLCEGVHAGLRKGTDAQDAGVLYDAIGRSQSSAWRDAITFAHDPFFSMWGGDTALRQLNAVLGD